MADRKSLFSRFWPTSASRRTPSTQTASPPPPPTTTRRTPESQSSTSQTSPTSSPPPPQAETKTRVRQSTTKASSPPTPAPTAPPKAEPRKASPEPSKSPAGELQTKDKPKTSSPSRTTTRSPSSSKPASPSRLSAQSRSPPQPPSPSHSSPQARISLPSPSPSPSRITSQSPSTPKRPSKPNSPSRVTSHSPKQGSSSPPKGKQPAPASPSKDPTQPTLPNDPKPAEVKEEVKPDSAVATNGQTQERRSFKHDDVQEKPSQSSQLHNAAPPAQGPETCETSKSLYSSTVNGDGHVPDIKLDAKPEETKDVKEVVKATKTEANDEKKKEVDDSVTPESTSEAQIVEKPQIPNEAGQIQREKQEAPGKKEILATPVDATASQPMKNSKHSGAHEHVPLQKNIKADMSKFSNELAGSEGHKKAISDRPVSVITLAGENRGASMHMESDSSKREGPIHIHRSYKSNPDQSPEAATTDGEHSSEGKKSEDERCMDDQVAEAYVNNNAQGINNSIVFNSSIVEGSPGVHMVVSHLPKEPMRSKDETSLAEARKAEVNLSRAEKLTYQPTIRRRCLRGLLLETSDSDQELENPEKPRRHGCRVACQKGDRENNVDVL